MALKFTTVKDASQLQGVKMLVYGPAGMGKTVLCATAPKPVIISAESGLLSVRQKNLERIHGVENPHISYNAHIIEISTVDDLTEAYQWCAYNPQAQGFETICLDSVSEIAEVVLSNAKRQVKDGRMAYGELLEKMQNVIRMFRDLQGKHVLFTAKMAMYEDKATGVHKYRPMLPGAQLGQQIPYFFDEVFRIGVNKNQQGGEYRFLQTQPDIQYEAKDRSGALDAIEQPLIYNVINKILGDQ